MLRLAFRFMAFLALVFGLVAPTLAADRAIIILDASGSMWAQIDGKSRIEIARATLKDVLKGVPADLELGFMAYGHRSKGDCNDIEMLVPPAAGTADAISAAADKLSPKGKTPLSAAVKMAAEALKYTEDKATVILITDGLETCDADPCALASELEQNGVDFTTHVVGFGLSDEEGAKVKCLAENTGGKYIQASDAEGLSKALAETVAEVTQPAPPPAPAADSAVTLMPTMTLTEDGPPVDKDADARWDVLAVKADGSAGDAVTTDYGIGYKGEIAPGDYILRASLDYAHVDQPVTIEAGKIAKPNFVMNAGHIKLRALPSEGADEDSGAAIYTEFPNGESTTSYGEFIQYVPAGDTRVEVTLGAGKVDDTISVAAGESVEKDIVVGVGHVVVNGFYVEGSRDEEGGMSVQIFEAKKDIQGNRKQAGYSYGPDSKFDLPPGDYVAVVQQDQASIETPFSVKAGEAVAVNAMLNAGVLAISAPDADNIELFSQKKDIQGNRQAFGNTYDVTANVTLPAGDYHIVVTLKNGAGTKEADASVAAGERNEVTVQ